MMSHGWVPEPAPITPTYQASLFCKREFPVTCYMPTSEQLDGFDDNDSVDNEETQDQQFDACAED